MCLHFCVQRRMNSKSFLIFVLEKCWLQQNVWLVGNVLLRTLPTFCTKYKGFCKTIHCTCTCVQIILHCTRSIPSNSRFPMWRIAANILKMFQISSWLNIKTWRDKNFQWTKYFGKSVCFSVYVLLVMEHYCVITLPQNCVWSANEHPALLQILSTSLAKQREACFFFLQKSDNKIVS